MSLLAAVHAAATWTMVGLIWTIQVVHYPLFSLVGADTFVRYEAAHTRRMGRLLVLPAFAEVLLAALLFVTRPDLLTFGAGALLAGIWIMTAFVHAPLHGRLADGYDAELAGRLTRANWWRTAAWTARGAIALVILL